MKRKNSGIPQPILRDWQGNPMPVPAAALPPIGNPCIAPYGLGPVGALCADCVHLRYAVERNPQARHYKCDLRRLSHGAATDHKVRWTACGHYEKREEEYHGG